ncbi:MAG: fibrobacter succinogenes major paralogous domain-containing protein [Bacteroidota bacterium]
MISFSQTVSNIQARQEGETIVVTYVLSGDPAYIQLEYDNGNGVFEQVIEAEGDIGNNISSGNKQITWKPSVLYSNSVVFRVSAIETRFTDPRDGKKYQTVKIGSQIWMAENLNYTTIFGSWLNSRYGRLYDWETAKTACPVGWHLPTDEEWKTLETQLGGSSIAGGKMKSTGTHYWHSPNTAADNSSGFSGLPGGNRYFDGVFSNIGDYGHWWSSTEFSTNNAWYRSMNYHNGAVNRLNVSKTYGFSVRCLRD